MRFWERVVRLGRLFVPVVLCGAVLAPTVAQPASDEFLTSDAREAWSLWRDGLQAVLDQDDRAAERAFGDLLGRNVSPLRLALLEQRASRRGNAGGALLLLEQDAEADRLGRNAGRLWERLKVGREQENQANDGWYFASLGRFRVANANFEALLEQNPDPVALMELADRYPERHRVLVQLAGNPIMGDSVEQVLELIREGERLVKSDPMRIRHNIGRLAGPPRAFENAVELLKDSGEYAVPFLIETLRDPQQAELTAPILQTLPQIDRPALNPLVAALAVPDEGVKIAIIETLGQIGYPQAVPYLLDVRDAATVSADVQQAASLALDEIAARGVRLSPSLTPAEACYQLAELYYNDHEPLAADPRFVEANVWYWREDILQNVPVPTDIFNEVMTMRLCQRALELSPDHEHAIALWLAANFRRVAQLGDGTDRTRPAGFPEPAYFAESAGAEYNQLALARAVKDGDPAVALGTIAALRKTAGPASLLGGPGVQQPLAAALAFPNRLVRVRAALALGNARPAQTFPNANNLMPVLAETIGLFTGVRDALVVDPDSSVANAVAAALRAEGYNVVIDAELRAGLQKIREQSPGVDALFLGSNVAEPELELALRELRSDFEFAALPVIIITREPDEARVAALVRGDYRLSQIFPTDPPDKVVSTLGEALQAVGAVAITPGLGLELALEAVGITLDLAESNNPLFEPAVLQPALIEALQQSTDRELRVLTARVLGQFDTPAAQQAIADLALDERVATDLRIEMLAALARSARLQGNLLPEAHVRQVLSLVQQTDDTALRNAASQALGALDVAGDPISELILTEQR